MRRLVSPAEKGWLERVRMPVHFASGGTRRRPRAIPAPGGSGRRDTRKRRCGARHTLHATTLTALRVPGGQT